eukprot:3860747-Ditylum_brightwellii.AAC.1
MMQHRQLPNCWRHLIVRNHRHYQTGGCGSGKREESSLNLLWVPHSCSEHRQGVHPVSRAYPHPSLHACSVKIYLIQSDSKGRHSCDDNIRLSQQERKDASIVPSCTHSLQVKAAEVLDRTGQPQIASRIALCSCIHVRHHHLQPWCHELHPSWP